MRSESGTKRVKAAEESSRLEKFLVNHKSAMERRLEILENQVNTQNIDL